MMRKLHPEHPRHNNILAALNKADYERILPDLELVEMPKGWKISEAGDHVKFVHFPISGIVSLIYDLENGASSETAMVGNEGMVGISIYMGGESMPSSTEVHCSGKAYRLSRSILKREFALGGQLQRLALLYTQALMAQTSQIAVCNRHHSVDQKLCRWLLMTLERLPDNQVAVTHSMIARLLGLRRESITDVAGKLLKDEVLEFARGRITVTNLNMLERRACECYGAVTKEYSRLLPTIK
ncbi:MAG: Crp/Fnr family transcriptional regulator [Methylotenera sp.]|nr:MAG: Crp/Fnr family transcriptional regulator [Methylotenera sp.]